MDLFFQQKKLSAFGKKGIIKPDADGYYTLVVGGLEVYNNGGSWYYLKDSLKNLFNPDTIFQRRLANGCLRAEANHPVRMPNESDIAFGERYMATDLKNVAAHFRKVWFDEDFGKNHPEYNNPNLIAIMAEVKPEGPMGPHLESALQSPSQNVCFSIRGAAGQAFYKGKTIRVIQDLFAIDWVNEGGLTLASKWDSPACESIEAADSMRVTKDLLDRISKESSLQYAASESSRESAVILLDRFYSGDKQRSAHDIYTKW